MMQNTFSGAYRLIHQNFAHCIRQCKWQLVWLRISQADRQAALRVSVDQQDVLSGLRQPDSQVGTEMCIRDRALTDQQVAVLLDTVKGLPPYLFIMLGLYSGLRREEILARCV